MKKLFISQILFAGLLLSACNHGGTTTRVIESDNNMKIEVEDYSVTPAIEFSKDYDVTGMDSAQKKELINHVFDSVGLRKER